MAPVSTRRRTLSSERPASFPPKHSDRYRLRKIYALKKISHGGASSTSYSMRCSGCTVVALPLSTVICFYEADVVEQKRVHCREWLFTHLFSLICFDLFTLPLNRNIPTVNIIKFITSKPCLGLFLRCFSCTFFFSAEDLLRHKRHTHLKSACDDKPQQEDDNLLLGSAI